MSTCPLARSRAQMSSPARVSVPVCPPSCPARTPALLPSPRTCAPAVRQPCIRLRTCTCAYLPARLHALSACPHAHKRTCPCCCRPRSSRPSARLFESLHAMATVCGADLTLCLLAVHATYECWRYPTLAVLLESGIKIVDLHNDRGTVQAKLLHKGRQQCSSVQERPCAVVLEERTVDPITRL